MVTEMVTEMVTDSEGMPGVIKIGELRSRNSQGKTEVSNSETVMANIAIPLFLDP